MIYETNQTKLVILGNGFDLCHNLRTNYADFRKWIISTYEICEEALETEITYLSEITQDKHGSFVIDASVAAKILIRLIDISSESEWNDFEESLGRINFSELFEEVYVPTDKEGDPEYSYYSDSLHQEAEPLLNLMPYIIILFHEWIQDIELNFTQRQSFFEPKTLSFLTQLKDEKTIFITFNYTSVLEQLYGIDSKKILQLHGKACNQKFNYEKLIVGHGNHQITDPENLVFGEYEFFLSSTFEAISKSLMKNTKQSNSNLVQFLDNPYFTDIIFFGFSFNSVDEIYIKTILSHTNASTTILINDFHFDENRKLSLLNKFNLLGFKGRIFIQKLT